MDQGGTAPAPPFFSLSFFFSPSFLLIFPWYSQASSRIANCDVEAKISSGPWATMRVEPLVTTCGLSSPKVGTRSTSSSSSSLASGANEERNNPRGISLVVRSSALRV
ncbi:hypothetical protein IWX49DRAFT_561023, partial [Phyllosticta citricarpa]